VVVLGVQMGSSTPVGRIVRDAEPHKQHYGRRRYSPSNYNNRRNGPNQALKQHGAQKFATGAGLFALGAVTGNSGWQNTGAGLAKLGLLSKLGAHFL